MPVLVDKVVLVSGGSQGLGAGIARAAAREGGTVVVTGRNAERGEAVASDLRATGSAIRLLSCSTHTSRSICADRSS